MIDRLVKLSQKEVLVVFDNRPPVLISSNDDAVALTMWLLYSENTGATVMDFNRIVYESLEDTNWNIAA